MVLGANRGLTGGLARFVAAPFVWLRVPPNLLTVCGLLLSVVPAYLASVGDWTWAGVALLLASVFDLLDGTVARATGRESKFGGYLDSVLDRASDAIVLLGIGFGIGTDLGWLLVGACLLLTHLISYSRARSYQDSTPPASTWNQVFERPERVLFLVIALVAHGIAGRLRPETDLLPWFLLIYALLGLWTVLARVWSVRAILEQTRK